MIEALLTNLVPYLSLGAIAGLLAGLLGIGGGLIIVPVLALLFHQQGFNEAIIMQLALGTSLATIVVTSLSSIAAHHRRGAVLWPVVRRLTPGIIVGVVAGSWLADNLDTQLLRRIFGLFACVVAVQMLLDFRPSGRRPLPGLWLMHQAGAVIGGISALVGIGGGTLTTPFLLWHNTSLRNAIATSAACGLPIALSGATAYLFTGLDQTQLPANSSGYLYWPAFSGIIISSLLCAPLGAAMTHRLPVTLIKKIFALILALVAVRLLAF